MTRYRQQLLPPLFNALMKYSDIHEYSWAAPGHQGGVGFTKTPAGRFITIIMAKTCSAAIWGLSVPRSVHSSTIPARLAKARKCRPRIRC